MLTDVLILIAGLALIVFGADWLVDGSSEVARKYGVSEFVIGLTIVGFGTSCPELVVSLTGALQGNADVSLGNVIGSNIFNTLLILGISSILSPIAVSAENRKKDIPITIMVSAILIAAVFLVGGLRRGEGILFLGLFVLYMIDAFKNGKVDDNNEGDSIQRKLIVSIALIAAGLAGLVFGGRMFVNSAVRIASGLGVSDKFIAITLLAGGTSLPELATGIVAAVKGKSQLALGNILGSNVFNILLILGCSAVITPLYSTGIKPMDLIALGSSIILLLIATYTGKKDRLDRWEGAVFLAAFAAYYIWLFANA